MFCKVAPVVLALAFVGGTFAPAADVIPTGEKVHAAKTFRASKLAGLNVRNSAGEKLGKVDDLVINVADGKVTYLAMSFGGILGLGDKLFAIPFSQVKFEHGQDEMYFVVHMDKEKLKTAPGFDKSHWPDFADPNWSSKIDEYYRQAQTTTTTTTTTTSEKTPK